MGLRKIHINAWIGTFLIIASAFFYTLTDEFFDPKAATWPRGVLVVTIVLSALLLGHGVYLTRRNAAPGIPEGRVVAAPLIALIMISAYAAAMQVAGFFVSTAVFLPLAMLAQRQKNWKVILGVTLGLELFVYLLFVVALGLRMP